MKKRMFIAGSISSVIITAATFFITKEAGSGSFSDSCIGCQKTFHGYPFAFTWIGDTAHYSPIFWGLIGDLFVWFVVGAVGYFLLEKFVTWFKANYRVK